MTPHKIQKKLRNNSKLKYIYIYIYTSIDVYIDIYIYIYVNTYLALLPSVALGVLAALLDD